MNHHNVIGKIKMNETTALENGAIIDREHKRLKKKLGSISDLAYITDLSIATLRVMIAKKVIKPLKFSSRRTLYDLDENVAAIKNYALERERRINGPDDWEQ